MEKNPLQKMIDSVAEGVRVNGLHTASIDGAKLTTPDGMTLEVAKIRFMLEGPPNSAVARVQERRG